MREKVKALAEEMIHCQIKFRQEGKEETGMRKLEELINELDGSPVRRGFLDREVLSGCCCDLLSWVAAFAKGMRYGLQFKHM